jgi:UPF0176 protein
MSNILNIAGYQFVSLSAHQLTEWRISFKERALACSLKGTILLSCEGINLFLAGLPENIAKFRQYLGKYSQFSGINFRETWSETQPFRRLLVRIKKEIISMGCPDIQPEQGKAPYIDPQTLREWYVQKRRMLVLDTRNHYEVECGSFDNAIELGLKNFRSFPEAVAQLPAEAKQLPIVTFCTGGIRCEKAALWLKKQGYPEVYQLQGGILNYFEQCGGDFFHGQCFVFDERSVVIANEFSKLNRHCER